MSLKTKFLNVMKSCAYVQKLGENSFHRYKYATAADVFEKINAALVAEGIISVAKPIIKSSETVTNAKGCSETRVTVEMTVTLTDAATGETLTLSGFGCGQDTGDKAIMKAQTAALKYTWMMSLNISTGDDPEADADVDARASEPVVSTKRSPSVAKRPEAEAGKLEKAQANQPTEPAKRLVSLEQLKVLFALAHKAGISPDEMKARIHAAYQVNTSRDLTREQASALIAEINNMPVADAV